MSDDGCGEDGWEIIGAENLASVSRVSAVTESLDTIFDVLSDPHRRYLLYYLLMMEGEIAEFYDVLNAVCTIEAAGRENSDYSVREVQLALHHVHLPRLEEAGIIDYDYHRGTIRFSGHPPIEEWVEHAQHKELNN